MANPSIDNSEVTNKATLCFTDSLCFLGRIRCVVLIDWFQAGGRYLNSDEGFGAVVLGKEDCEDGRDGEYACCLVTELPAAFSAERGDISERVGLWERGVACRSRVFGCCKGI